MTKPVYDFQERRKKENKTLKASSSGRKKKDGGRGEEGMKATGEGENGRGERRMGGPLAHC